MTRRDAVELITTQIIDLLRAEEKPTRYCAPAARLGAPELGLSGNELIEIVLALERSFGVRLPDEQAEFLEAMTVEELTAAFAAQLCDRSLSGARQQQLPTRRDVLLLVAEARGAEPHEVSEDIDSLTRMWLLHSMEQRYGTPMEIPAGLLAEMESVDGAVRVLRQALHRTVANVPPG
jgi:acyl carrier protein